MVRICVWCQKTNKDIFYKFCSLVCSKKYIAKINHERSLAKYLENPKTCPNCNSIIPYGLYSNKFCSIKCGTTISNAKRVVSRSTREKLRISASKIPEFTRNSGKTSRNIAGWNKKPRIIRHCLRCETAFECKFDSSKTYCSPSCSGGSNKKRVFYAGVWLDSSWELKLAKSLDACGISWERPKTYILSDGRKYTPDFCLPKFGLFVDPKAIVASRKDSTPKVGQFANEYFTRCIVINSYNLLTWEYTQSLAEDGDWTGLRVI
jgi:hypothetical protein